MSLLFKIRQLMKLKHLLTKTKIMKIIQFKLRYLALLGGLFFMLTSCENEPLANQDLDIAASLKAKSTKLFGNRTVRSVSDKSLNSVNATYEYFSVSLAMASNGETMYVSGDNSFEFVGSNEGTLSVYPKSVQGTGEFWHFAVDGSTLLGSGTWEATKLLSFKDYGTSPFLEGLEDPFYDGWKAGSANIRIHLVADGGAEFDAILRIRCNLPEVSTPPSWAEGMRITVQDGLNFNKTIEGDDFFTLFILR